LTTPSALAVETSGLLKLFGTTRAVDGVALQVPTGSVYGVLGPNGAGKTTIIRILVTLLRPDAGTARVFGHDVVADADAVRDRVSLTGQYASVDNDLTGRENLVLLARLLGFSRRQAKTGPGSCWMPSAWPKRPTGSSAPTPGACDGGWTSRPV
jgi:ABC-2 type transport system ATP-binding protein